MGSILVVCTGNICRSPVGAAALRALLPVAHYAVSSAGTHAAVDRPSTREANAFVERELSVPLAHAGRQLTNEQAGSSDLIITMTAEHRAWVARTVPHVVRRSFTLLELEAIVSLLPSDARYESLRDFTHSASRLRARAKTTGDALDIPDPYGGPSEGYEDSFTTVLTSARLVAAAISTHVDNKSEGGRS